MSEPINFEAATLAFLLQFHHGKTMTIDELRAGPIRELVEAGLVREIRATNPDTRRNEGDVVDYETTRRGRDVARAMLYAGLEEYRRTEASAMREAAPKEEPDHAREDNEGSDVIIAGRQVPFVQVGMIVHPDDCLNCERDGSPLWCSALVCDIHDDDETARFGMMATLLFRNGERREEPCDELRRRWRIARDFDQSRVYTGRWGAAQRGSSWPVAEINEEA